MMLRLKTAKLLLFKVIWPEMTGQPVLFDAVLASLSLSEMFGKSSLVSIRLHGANGNVTNCEIARNLHDAIGGLIYSGMSGIQPNIVARLVGL